MPQSAYERLLREFERQGILGVLHSVTGYCRNTSGIISKYYTKMLLQSLLSERLLNSNDVERYVAEETWHYGEEEQIEISPDRMQSYPESFEPLLGQYQVATPSVSEVRNVELYGPDCLMRTESGEILLDGSGVDTFFLAESILRYCKTRSITATLKWLFSRPEMDSNASSEVPVFSLVSPRSGNYYHWTTEFLPKIRALRHYEEVTGTRPEVLVDAKSPNWKWESLRLLGIDEERCEEWNGGCRMIDRLVLPRSRIKRRSVLTPSPSDIKWAPLRFESPYLLTPPPADIEWVRDTVLSNTGESSFDGRKRIYISRDDASLRRVVNESEVVKLLESNGFEPYVLSELNVAEQATLFANADVVVAPHGAGLSNIIYSKDIKIIELFLNTVVRPFFFVHAMEHGFGYECIICEQNGSDMFVDIEELRATVEAV